MMLGRLEYLELVDLDRKTEFPQWQVDERKEINVKQLLQMISGLKFDETYAPGSDSTRMLFTSHSASDVAMEAMAGDLPGEHFSYSSGTTNILMRLMREQLGSNQMLINFFYEEILKPASMTQTTFEVDPSGSFVGSSYLFASARDWAQMGLVMLNIGEINGSQLLSPDRVLKAQTANQSQNYKEIWLSVMVESRTR